MEFRELRQNLGKESLSRMEKDTAKNVFKKVDAMIQARRYDFETIRSSRWI